jgi:hypothetical protein
VARDCDGVQHWCRTLLSPLVSSLRSPNLQITALGADAVDWVIAKASSGEYSPEDDELSWLTNPILESLFNHVDGVFRVKDWIREGVRWTVADARSSKLLDELGPADLLLANNFLGAMSDQEAEACMENLLRLVSPGGYFVFNGNLDVKTRFAKKHALVAVNEGIEAIHFGDPSRLGWPWTYFASEPLDKSRPDWQTRYAAVFVRGVEIAKSTMGRPAKFSDLGQYGTRRAS